MPIGAVDWRDRAKCRGMDTNMFFPTAGPQATLQYAKCRKVCMACPVQEQCLKETLFIEEKTGGFPQGFAGGKTPQERRVLLGFREAATAQRIKVTA